MGFGRVQWGRHHHSGPEKGLLFRFDTTGGRPTDALALPDFGKGEPAEAVPYPYGSGPGFLGSLEVIRKRHVLHRSHRQAGQTSGETPIGRTIHSILGVWSWALLGRSD